MNFKAAYFLKHIMETEYVAPHKTILGDMISSHKGKLFHSLSTQWQKQKSCPAGGRLADPQIMSNTSWERQSQMEGRWSLYIGLFICHNSS